MYLQKRLATPGEGRAAGRPQSGLRAAAWNGGSDDLSLLGLGRAGGGGAWVPSSWGQEKPYFEAGTDLRSRMGAPRPPAGQRTAPRGSAQEGARISGPSWRSPSPASSRGAPPSPRVRPAPGSSRRTRGQATPAPAQAPSHAAPLSPAPRLRPRPASARAPTQGASDWPAAGPGCQRRLRPGWPWVPAAQATPRQPLPPRSRLQAAPGLPLRLQFWRRSPAALQLGAGAPTHLHPCLSAGSLLTHALRCGRCPRHPEARWPEPGPHR